MPEVSVLMAVLNGETYLAEAIESILHQTFRDFEFVMVDDGSTDRTPVILANYASSDRRIRVLTNVKTLGLARSLNRGLAELRGEYVARQDADDLSLSYRLGIQVSHMRSRPETGLMSGAHYLMDSARGLFDLIRLPETDTEIRWRLLFHNSLCHPAVMFRRSLAPPDGRLYDESLASSQDYELWNRLIRGTRAGNTITPLIARRHHPAQVSAWHGWGPGRDRDGVRISSIQLARLLPFHSFTEEEVDCLRAWHAAPAVGITRAQARERVDLAAEVFHAFENLPRVNPETAERLRRKWLDPLVDRASGGRGVGSNGLRNHLETRWAELNSTWWLRRSRAKGAAVKHFLTHRRSPWSTPRPFLGFTSGVNDPRSLRKRALMAYVCRPFHMQPEEIQGASHSSVEQSLEIARAFNRLGYSVDVIDWLDEQSIPSGRYDAFFGMHHNFGRLQPFLPEECVKIYYATGAYWAFENAAEAARAAELEARRGIRVPLPQRLPPNDWVEKADAVVVIGNRFDVSTYEGRNPAIHPIDNTCLPVAPPDLARKNFRAARRHFLWFSGVGVMHKGLDLVLEVFTELKELHLWVCGMLQAENEQPFVRAFRKELFRTPNIHPVGWVDVRSTRFNDLTDRCAALVVPSCSEAMAGSVITCLGRGMIPIVSRETGVDTNDFGVTLRANTVGEIRAEVLRMAAADPETLRRRTHDAHLASRTRYTIEAFSRNMENILRTILTEHA